MESNDKLFNVKKTFGLGVLMKLTKKNMNGIIIESVGDRLVSNSSLDEIKEAVAHITRSHRIRIKV